MTDTLPPKNDFYTILFEEAPIGLGLSDMSGKLILHNKMFQKISGYTDEDIEQIGNVSNLYYNPEDRQVILNKTIKDGFIENYPVKFKKKDGTYFDSLISLSPVTYNGKPHFLAIVQDITKQVQAEKEIADKIEELEKMNKMMIGRELNMLKLKETIRDLKNQQNISTDK